ncbi:MAG: HD domain-containing protein [Planctomycetaceae bacterium]
MFPCQGLFMNSEIQKAREFAVRAHAAQRYGEHPYSYHLDAVAEIVAPFGEQAQIAAYLHDTVEDCDVTIAEIADAFGKQMADCVALLTDEPGESRPIRKARTNQKLSTTANSLALIVKAADRLANLRESLDDSEAEYLAMYRREHEEFRKAVYRPGLCDEIWDGITSIVDA